MKKELKLNRLNKRGLIEVLYLFNRAELRSLARSHDIARGKEKVDTIKNLVKFSFILNNKISITIGD